MTLTQLKEKLNNIDEELYGDYDIIFDSNWLEFHGYGVLQDVIIDVDDLKLIIS